MANILDFYSGQATQITRIVDQTYRLVLANQDSILAQIAPVVDYADSMLLIMKFSRSKPTIASLIGNEQELPIGASRVVISEALLQEARIGKQHVFNNEDFIAMNRLTAALMNRLPDSGLVTDFMNIFFGYAGEMPTAIVEKLTLILMSILISATVDYNDPLTGAKFNLTYPDAITTGLNQLLFTATPLPADLWTTVATANGLAQLETHARTWNIVFGTWPQRLVMRSSLLLSLKLQTTTRQAVASSRGYAATAGDVASIYISDEDVINQIKMRTHVAEVLLLDAMYSVEDSLGNISDLFFMPDTHYFFNEDNNVQRAFVPTPEKDFAPGIYVNWRSLNDAPRRERIAGVGAGIPAVFDGRKLAARRVA